MKLLKWYILIKVIRTAINNFFYHLTFDDQFSVPVFFPPFRCISQVIPFSSIIIRMAEHVR